MSIESLAERIQRLEKAVIRLEMAVALLAGTIFGAAVAGVIIVLDPWGWL